MAPKSRKKTEAENGYAEIGAGLVADVSALRTIRHECVQCGRAHSCCSTYEVEITWTEIRRIDSLLPQIVRHRRALRTGPNEYRDVFRDADDDVMVIDTGAESTCPFLVRSSGRCAIHAAAIDLGLEPFRTKPLLCAAWPLAVQPIGPQRILLSADDTASQFPCTKKVWSRRIRPEVYDIVTRLFGDAVADRLRECDEDR